MKTMTLANVRKHTGGNMSLEEAQKVVGNQPDYALAGMAVALSLHSWNNTPEDWRRFEAALVVRNHRRSTRQERH